jgi:L-asparaginase
METRRCVILGTGGTIAGRATRPGDGVGYVAGQVRVEDLLASIPSMAGLPLEVEQVAQVDSKDMGFALWQQLAIRVAFHLKRPEVDAVVITHGTDTIEETAFFLQTVLRPAKPVVFTCAMRPATALVPDGPQNLVDAMAVASQPGAQGVVLVCAGQIHSAADVSKVHTYRVDAFDSGDAGPLGCVEEGRLRLFRSWPSACETGGWDAVALQRIQSAQALPPVVMLTSHADADGTLVRALLFRGDSVPGPLVRGIVVAGTGNGTVHHALEAALLEAQTMGVRVVRTSRCVHGPLLPHPGQLLTDARSLTPVKARIALALELLEG